MNKLLLLLLFVVFFACSDNDSSPDECNPDNPLRMDWMKEWVADLQLCSCTISIFQAEYNGKPVFWQLMTDPLCHGVFEEITIYCCTGCELLVLKSYDDLLEFQEKTSDLKIIYQCTRP